MDIVKAEHPGIQILGNQLLAASGAAAGENLTAIFGGHAGAKTVGAFAFQIAGLECSFHDITT